MRMKRSLPTLTWIVTSFATLAIITSRWLKVLVVVWVQSRLRTNLRISLVVEFEGGPAVARILNDPLKDLVIIDRSRSMIAWAQSKSTAIAQIRGSLHHSLFKAEWDIVLEVLRKLLTVQCLLIQLQMRLPSISTSTSIIMWPSPPRTPTVVQLQLQWAGVKAAIRTCPWCISMSKASSETSSQMTECWITLAQASAICTSRPIRSRATKHFR